MASLFNCTKVVSTSSARTSYVIIGSNQRSLDQYCMGRFGMCSNHVELVNTKVDLRLYIVQANYMSNGTWESIVEWIEGDNALQYVEECSVLQSKESFIPPNLLTKMKKDLTEANPLAEVVFVECKKERKPHTKRAKPVEKDNEEVEAEDTPKETTTKKRKAAVVVVAAAAPAEEDADDE